MKRFLLALTICVLAAGCSLFGSDDCDGREGLFIQTDRNSYQVGDEATVTVENCTGEIAFFDEGFNEEAEAEYDLEKKIDGVWKLVDEQGGGAYSTFLEEIEPGEEVDLTLPAEPQKDKVDTVAGTYRYELDIRNSEEDFLAKGRRRSNTFEITE